MEKEHEYLKKNARVHHKIVCILQDYTRPDQYNIFILRSAKSTSDNQLIGLVMYAKAKPRLGMSWKELIEYYHKTLTRKEKFDYLITNSTDFKRKMPSAYYYSYFQNKEEHQMAMLYLDSFRKLKNPHGAVQKLTTERELILNEGADKREYRFDLANINPATWAFVFTIHALNKNDFSSFLKLIQE